MKGRREHSPAFPFAARSIVAMPLVLGLLGGVAIALATVLVEHSRIEFGRYALYGNGAFAVPAVGVPLALYAGWTELARSHAERARRVAVALFTAGLYFGIGAWSPLEVVLFPQSSVERLADAIPGLLLQGLLWVLPPALVAALVWWIYTKIPLTPLTLVVGYLIGMPFALVFGIVTMGTLAGTAVAHGLSVVTPRARTAIGALVVALALVATFGVPLLVLGPGGGAPPRGGAP